MTKEKAIEILNEWYDEGISCRKIMYENPDDAEYYNDLLIALLTAIDALQDSSVEVEPVKHGKWVYQRDNLWLCSYCKENLIYSEIETDRAEKQRYCSRCGARMGR